MKKIAFKIICMCCCIATLASCTNSNILKTKDITTALTQTNVIIEPEINTAEQYEIFNKSFISDFTVPGLFEGVIPQGICYDGLSEAFIISGYYEDGIFPSVLMVVDAKSGTLKSYHPLKNIDNSDYFGHAGGIASSDDYIFITSDSCCYTISTAQLTKAKDNQPVSFEACFSLNTKGSFAGFDNGILWVGDFIESSDGERKNVERVTTLDSGETLYAYCEGYILKDGLPDVKKINSFANGYIPDYMLAIPEQVQGIAFTDSGKIIFSTSYGRKNDSYLYIYDDVLISERAGTVTVDKTEIDLLACSSELLYKKITLPPMAEGITEGIDGFYILFESGAEKYRNHRGKYPVDTVYKTDFE